MPGFKEPGLKSRDLTDPALILKNHAKIEQMVTVAILTADQRLGFQIHQWMKEMSDSVRWQLHLDPAEFASKIETEIAADLIASSKSDANVVIDAEDIGSGKSKELTDAFVRLVLVDLELLVSRSIEPIEWTRKLKQLMLDRQRSDPLHPTKFMFMAFEGGNFKVDSLRNAVVDDLVLKPLDRSVFLQKVEILTSDDLNLKPSYLFRQKAVLPIEIGKDAHIDEISEFAVGIRNPVPLAPGVFASIHSSVFGGPDSARVIGRVYKSQPHPTIQGATLVYFSYFGLRSDQLVNVKKYMRERQPKQPHRAVAPAAPNVDPAVPFNRVAIVDMDMDVFHEIQSTLKDHFVGVNVTHYLSYARLLATLKNLYRVANVETPAAAPSAGTPAAPTDVPEVEHVIDENDPAQFQAWTTQGSITLITSANEQELIKFETALASGDTVLGRTRLEWLERPGDFFSNLDKLDANELREMIDYAVSGGRGRSFLKLKNQVEKTFYVEAHSTLSRSAEGEISAQVAVELKLIDEAEYRASHPNVTDAKAPEAADLRYDAIYIDANLIRGELQAWWDGLHEVYMKSGVVAPGQPMPKIILLADEKSKVRPENYRSKLIDDFMFKPLDRKVVSYKSKEIIELIARKEPELPPFVKSEISAKLAKDALTEEISEYGLSIQHPTSFKPGSIVRVFSPLLGGGADGVLARCHYCEEKKAEKSTYWVCNFIFFGTPDEILKRIRTWIREDYIHKKEGV